MVQSLYGSLTCAEQSLHCSLPFDPHIEGSNEYFAPHMEGSHKDFAPHIERINSFRDNKIAKLPFLPLFKTIYLNLLFLGSLCDLFDNLKKYIFGGRVP